jgi:membrane associated rhomboid family serine protease
MGALIPLTDASRRPAHIPVVTGAIILANFMVFGLELERGVGSIATAQSGGVAYVAHVAGLLFGALTARLFRDRQRLAAQL